MISRRIEPVRGNVYTGYTAGFILWAVSVRWFKVRYFVKDRNMFNWILFSAGSAYSSLGFTKFLFETSYDGAAEKNNYEEVNHQKTLGNL